MDDNVNETERSDSSFAEELSDIYERQARRYDGSLTESEEKR